MNIDINKNPENKFNLRDEVIYIREFSPVDKEIERHQHTEEERYNLNESISSFVIQGSTVGVVGVIIDDGTNKYRFFDNKISKI